VPADPLKETRRVQLRTKAICSDFRRSCFVVLRYAREKRANDYATTEEIPVVRRRPNRIPETQQADGCLTSHDRRDGSQRLATVHVAQPVSCRQVDAPAARFDDIAAFEQQCDISIA
jgi:hypothetical protein